jgi:type VI secretion system protein ImpA
MPLTELHNDTIAGHGAVIRTIDETVLLPLQGGQPAGDDLRKNNYWVDLRAARPKPPDPQANPIEAARLAEPEWTRYRDLLLEALSNRTKDLELALYFVEANSRVHRFAGLRDGLWLLENLIRLFAAQGLHPLAEDGDLEIQYGKLDWLDEKLPDVASELPITFSKDDAPGYSLNYYNESRRPGGMITAAAFDEAAKTGRVEDYLELRDTIEETLAELKRLKQTVEVCYGSQVSSFSVAEETLTECRSAVDKILSKRRSDGQINKAPSGAGTSPGISQLFKQTAVPAPSDGNRAEAWSRCEEMARSGDVNGALAAMMSLSAVETNGRVRFQRRLLLADLCLQSDRKKLAISILQELNETIELHKLDTWETADVVGGVWSRLVQCYRDHAGGTADENLASAFYLKLSRLDPWQAVACGEPKKEH